MKHLVPKSMLIDKAKLRRYAALTNDFNPIHVDLEFAVQTPMGGIIAHGTLGMNLIWQSLEESVGPLGKRGINLDVRFVKAVREGAILTSGGRCVGTEGNRYEVWVTDQEGAPVIAGTAELTADSSYPVCKATPEALAEVAAPEQR